MTNTRDRIRAYVKYFPGVTMPGVAKALNLSISTVATALHAMTLRGEFVRHKGDSLFFNKKVWKYYERSDSDRSAEAQGSSRKG